MSITPSAGINQIRGVVAPRVAQTAGSPTTQHSSVGFAKAVSASRGAPSGSSVGRKAMAKSTSMSWNDQKRAGALFRDELLSKALDTDTPADRDGADVYEQVRSQTKSTEGVLNENISALDKRVRLCEAAVLAVRIAAVKAGMAGDGKTMAQIDALKGTLLEELGSVRKMMQAKPNGGAKLPPVYLEASLTSKKPKAAQAYEKASRKFLSGLESLVNDISAKAGKSGSWKLNLSDMMVNHVLAPVIAKEMKIAEGDAFKYIIAQSLDACRAKFAQFDPASNAPLTDFGFVVGQVFELFLPSEEALQSTVPGDEQGASFLGGSPGQGAGQAATPGLGPRPGANGNSRPEDAGRPTDDIDGTFGPGVGETFVGPTADAAQTPRAPLIGTLNVVTDNSTHCTNHNTTYNISLGFTTPAASAGAAFPFRATDLAWSEASVTRDSTETGVSAPNADVISPSEQSQGHVAPKQSSSDASTAPTVSPSTSQSNAASSPTPSTANASAAAAKKAGEPAGSATAKTQSEQEGERSTFGRLGSGNTTEASSDGIAPTTVSPRANPSNAASLPSPSAVTASAVPSKKAGERASSASANAQVEQDGERSTCGNLGSGNIAEASLDGIAPPTVSPRVNPSNAASVPSPSAVTASAVPSKKVGEPASSASASAQVQQDDEHSTFGSLGSGNTTGTSLGSIAPTTMRQHVAQSDATSRTATSNVAESAGTLPRNAEAGIAGTGGSARRVEQAPLNAPATNSLAEQTQGVFTAKTSSPHASSKPAATQNSEQTVGKKSATAAVASRLYDPNDFIRPASHTIPRVVDAETQNRNGGEDLLSLGHRSMSGRVGGSLRHSPGKPLVSEGSPRRIDWRADRSLGTPIRHIPHAISSAPQGEDEVDVAEMRSMDDIDAGDKHPMRSGSAVAPSRMPNVYDAGLDSGAGGELASATRKSTATVVSRHGPDVGPLVGGANMNRSSGRVSRETLPQPTGAVKDEPKVASAPRGETFVSSQSAAQRSDVSGSARNKVTNEAKGPENWRRMAMMLSKSSGANIPKKLTAQESELNVHLFPKETTQSSTQKGLWWDTDKFVTPQYVVDDFQSELESLRADSPNKSGKPDNRETATAVTEPNLRQAAQRPQET